MQLVYSAFCIFFIAVYMQFLSNGIKYLLQTEGRARLTLVNFRIYSDSETMNHSAQILVMSHGPVYLQTRLTPSVAHDPRNAKASQTLKDTLMPAFTLCINQAIWMHGLFPTFSVHLVSKFAFCMGMNLRPRFLVFALLLTSLSVQQNLQLSLAEKQKSQHQPHSQIIKM